MIIEFWTLVVLTTFADDPPFVGWSEPIAPIECRSIKMKAHRVSPGTRTAITCIQSPAWFIYPSRWTVMNGEIYQKHDGQWVLWKEYPVRKPKTPSTVGPSKAGQAR